MMIKIGRESSPNQLVNLLLFDWCDRSVERKHTDRLFLLWSSCASEKSN